MRLVSLLMLAGLVGPVGAGDQFMLDHNALRAQLNPVRYATLSAGMTGRVSRMQVREGDRVESGAVLVEFDCGLQRAQLAKAQAQVASARNTVKGNQRMAELNAIGSVELVNSELEVRKAQADVRYLEATIERCSVRAPYAGVIGDQHVRQEEFIREGSPMLEILDDTSLQLEFIAPSRWLGWMVPGFGFEVRLEDTQQTYPVRLSYTAAKVDAMSQSIKVVGAIDGKFPELRPGMSGLIELTPPNQVTNQ